MILMFRQSFVLFFFFFFFLIWEKVFWEFEKKNGLVRTESGKGRRKPLGPLSGFSFFPPPFPCDRKTRLCLPNGYSINHFVVFDQSSLKHNSEDDLPKMKMRASLSVCIYIYENLFSPFV